MAPTATPIEGAIPILAKIPMDSVTVLTVRCQGYEEFAKLPDAITYEGKSYGKTGWNSDVFKAYYRDDATFALAVR